MVDGVGNPGRKYWGTDSREHSLIGRQPNVGLITKSGKDGKTVNVTIDDTSPLFSTLLKQTRVQRFETAKVLRSDLTNLMNALLKQPDLQLTLNPELAREIIYVIGKEYHAAGEPNHANDDFVEKFARRFSGELGAEFLMTSFRAGWAGSDLPQKQLAAVPNKGWNPNA